MRDLALLGRVDVAIRARGKSRAVCWVVAAISGALWWWYARCRREEARRLHLGEIELGASVVALIHGLSQPTFGPVAPENDAVDENCDDFDDDFDDCADKGPVL